MNAHLILIFLLLASNVNAKPFKYLDKNNLYAYSTIKGNPNDRAVVQQDNVMIKNTDIINAKSKITLSNKSFDFNLVTPDTKIIMISAYEGTSVNINIDLPKQKVLLILPSYHTIGWHLNISKETDVIATIVSTYSSGNQAVLYSSTSVKAYKGAYRSLRYAYNDDTKNFKNILHWLNEKNSNIKSFDFFYGEYRISGTININSKSLIKNKKWSISWPPVSKTTNKMSFSLIQPFVGEKSFTLKGSVNKENISFLPPQSIAIVPQKNIYFQISSNGIDKFNLSTWEKIDSYPLPSNFKRFSWPKGIAYNSKDDQIVVTTSHVYSSFYRFDVKNDVWKDYKTFNRSIAAGPITYDNKNNYFVASRSRKAGLIFISADGKPLKTVDLQDKLPGLNQTYDKGNGPVPELSLISNGDDIAILLVSATRYSSYKSCSPVQNIWYYNKKDKKAILTYKNNSPSALGKYPSDCGTYQSNYSYKRKAQVLTLPKSTKRLQIQANPKLNTKPSKSSWLTTNTNKMGNIFIIDFIIKKLSTTDSIQRIIVKQDKEIVFETFYTKDSYFASTSKFTFSFIKNLTESDTSLDFYVTYASGKVKHISKELTRIKNAKN